MLHKFATAFLEECVPGLYRIYYNPVWQKGDLKAVLLSNYDFLIVIWSTVVSYNMNTFCFAQRREWNKKQTNKQTKQHSAF